MEPCERDMEAESRRQSHKPRQLQEQEEQRGSAVNQNQGQGTHIGDSVATALNRMTDLLEFIAPNRTKWDCNPRRKRNVGEDKP